MAQETIDAIRQAETVAEATEKEAIKGVETIMAEAEAQMAQMKAVMTKSVRESAVGAEEDVRTQSEQMMQAAGVEEGKDSEALQKAVAEKQQKVVEVILSELLQEGRYLRLAIVPMKKVLICGFKEDRKDTLELLQRQGTFEISNMLRENDMLGRTDVVSSKIVFERNASITEQATNILGRYAPGEKSMSSSFEGRGVLSLDECEANADKHDEVMKKVHRSQELTKRVGEYSAVAPRPEQ